MRHQAARAFVLASFALTVYLLYLIFQPFLSAIAWAVFLVTAFHPMHRRVLKVFGGRETLAAVLSTLIVVALILLPTVLLVSSVAQTVGVVLSYAEDSLREAAAHGPLAVPENPDVPAASRAENHAAPAS